MQDDLLKGKVLPLNGLIVYFCRKKSDRLEWMYSAPGHSGVNHEDYLLGKAIDKAVDPLATNDEKVPI